MPHFKDGTRSSSMENFDLANRQFREGLYAEAAKSYGRTIELGGKDSKAAWEGKARSLLRLSKAQREASRARVPSSWKEVLPDGSAAYQSAYEIAKKAAEKHGKERWQVLDARGRIQSKRVLHHCNQYTAASSMIAKALAHPAFKSKATPEQVKHLTKFKDKIDHDRRFNDQRVKGRDEAERIAHELHAEAMIKSKTNYENILSPDIFLHIVQIGEAADPGIAVRMSGVCKRWREVVVSQPRNWQTLRLGPGKNQGLKVRTFLERTGRDEGERGFLEVRITERFDYGKNTDISKLLAIHMPHVKRLRVCHVHAAHILGHWQGLMRSLEILQVEAPPSFKLGAKAMDFNLLSFDATTLRELRLSRVDFQMAYDQQQPFNDPTNLQTSFSWTDNLDTHARNLEVLHLHQCGMLPGIQGGVRTIIRHAPLLRQVQLNELVTPIYTVPTPNIEGDDFGVSKDTTRLELPHLVEWVEQRCTHDTGFLDCLKRFGMPKLQSFEQWSSANLALKTGDMLRTDAFLSIAKELRSFSIGRSDITQADEEDLLYVLAETKQLEFLNLAYCDLSADFFDRLIQGMSSNPPLLPALQAISLAGIHDLRAPTIRDLVNARLPLEGRIPVASSGSASAKQPVRSAFAPTKIAKTPAPSQIVPSSQTSQKGLNTALIPGVDSQSAHGPSPPTPITPLRWLNIDQCEQVDPVIFPSVGKRLGFFSHWMAGMEEDRLRGRGKWDWRFDLGVECRGEGSMMVLPVVFDAAKLEPEVPKCTVKFDPASGQHYIHHICRRGLAAGGHHDDDDEVGWSQASQTDAKGAKGKKRGIRSVQEH